MIGASMSRTISTVTWAMKRVNFWLSLLVVVLHCVGHTPSVFCRLGQADQVDLHVILGREFKPVQVQLTNSFASGVRALTL
ncbi:hypothetical protein BaRGS_00018966 [Batillaria attramentaria]|uniref:Secreted protein n=1 Tax=Batillaria attramentaria TaxID=370345 RepID=A0ABD0KRG9_9CAEN